MSQSMKQPTPGDMIKSSGGGGGIGGGSGSGMSSPGGLSQTFKKPKTLVCYIW